MSHYFYSLDCLLRGHTAGSNPNAKAWSIRESIADFLADEENQ